MLYVQEVSTHPQPNGIQNPLIGRPAIVHEFVGGQQSKGNFGRLAMQKNAFWRSPCLPNDFIKLSGGGT